MRMKKGLLVVVALLAIASIMAAIAYNSATITNRASLRVVNTTSAILSLHAWNGVKALDNDYVGNKDMDIEIVNGDLVIDLSGVQRNSVYVWNRCIQVRNNSLEDIKFTIESTLAKYITVRVDHSNFSCVFVNNGVNTGNYFELTPSGVGQYNINIAIELNIPADAELETLTGQLIVKGIAI